MTESTKTLILGAGLTGLAAAYFLKKPRERIVCEKNERPGGLCDSYTKDGFTFDMTGHLLHFRRPELKRLAKRLLPKGFAEVQQALLNMY